MLLELPTRATLFPRRRVPDQESLHCGQESRAKLPATHSSEVSTSAAKLLCATACRRQRRSRCAHTPRKPNSVSSCARSRGRSFRASRCRSGQTPAIGSPSKIVAPFCKLCHGRRGGAFQMLCAPQLHQFRLSTPEYCRRICRNVSETELIDFHTTKKIGAIEGSRRTSTRHRGGRSGPVIGL